MNQTKSIALITSLAGVFALTATILIPYAMAADTTEVNATVTIQNISLTLTTDGSISFGTIGTSSTEDTTTAGVNDTETVQNNGNVTIDVNIQSEDTDDWTLANTAGANEFTVKSCITSCDVSPTWSSVGISPSYATLQSDLTTSSTQPFDIQFGSPTTSSDFTQQTVTITLQAVSS